MSFKNPVRETTVTLEVNDDQGRVVKQEVIVRYKSYSIRQLQEREKLFETKKAAGKSVYISETLAPRLVEMVENGTVIEITQDLLDEMDIDNLKAIEKAIDGATDPK